MDTRKRVNTLERRSPPKKEIESRSAQQLEECFKRWENKFDAKLGTLQEAFQKMEVEVKQELHQLDVAVKEMKGDLQGINIKMKTQEDKVIKLETESCRIQDMLALAEQERKQASLRFRAIPEQQGEDIRNRMLQILAQFLQIDQEELDLDLDKVYRINTRYAAIKKVPRDVLVHFVRQRTRDKVLQQHSKSRLKVEGVHIIVLKEIPLRILQKRKSYAFLVEVLKKKNITFRWGKLEGVIVKLHGKTYRLDTIQKAKEFLGRDADGGEEEEEGMDSVMDVICLQETHIKKGDTKFLIQKSLGEEFFSTNIKKKNGVVLYVKKYLKPELIFSDDKGRGVAVEVTLDGIKTLVLGVYTPHQQKGEFFRYLMDLLANYSYSSFCLLGDWNGVVSPLSDKSSEKEIKHNQGKLPKSFFEMVETLGVLDIWRRKNGNSKEFTHYSERHGSSSRIDMFWVSKDIAVRTSKAEILTKSISDHNPIVLAIRKKIKTYRWRLNELLLQKEEIIEEAKSKLKDFFELNMNKGTEARMVWDASKAFIRGYFIQKNAEWTKKRQIKFQKIEEEMKKKEQELRATPGDKKVLQQIKILQSQLSLMITREIEIKMKYAKQKHFEHANKPGKFLAYKLRKEREKRIISKLQETEKTYTEQEDIQKLIVNYYTNLYKRQKVESTRIKEYLAKQNLPKVLEEYKLILNERIMPREVAEAIKRVKLNKAPGPDGLTGRFYKCLEDVISIPLQQTMNDILQNRRMPDSWKEANITLIPKEGQDLSSIKNYRPISLLNNDYKIFTSILAERMKKMLQNFIHEDQCGFLPKRHLRDNTFEIQKGTRQGCPLSPLLFILVLEVLSRNIRQDERIHGVKIKKETFKLRAFADDLVLMLENPLKDIELLMNKLKEFGSFAGFKVNKQKTKIVTKNMKTQDQLKLMNKTGFQVEKKVKYLGIVLTSMNCMLFQNNYVKVWNEIKKDLLRWERLKLSLLGRISVIKMNVLPKMMFLFQTIPVIISDAPFKEWQKDISKFIWQGKKPRVKYKILQDAKERGGLGLPDLKVYHAACCFVWLKEWMYLQNRRLLELEGSDLRFGWHGYM
nr:hypothetical protein [Tanacetum cinerariifolium]